MNCTKDFCHTPAIAPALCDSHMKEWVQTQTHEMAIVTNVGYGHRAAYILFRGPIPAKMQIDHKCRNTLCVNPTHLEVVTHAENARRKGAAVTQCPQGHPYTVQNTYISKNGARHCKICTRTSAKQWRTNNLPTIYSMAGVPQAILSQMTTSIPPKEVR
jgi:hypothetical protein